MKPNKKSTNDTSKKGSKQEKNSSGYMKFFYALMLLLIASSSIIRFAGAKRQSTQGVETPAPVSAPVGSGLTAARALIFRRENSGTNSCAELTITTASDAVYSNCGHGLEKQYALNDAERTQLENWIGQFKPITYNQSDNVQTGKITTQLFLNGHGVLSASDTETQQIIDFAESLGTKIAAQP
jgi:hypothetical protein